MKRKSLLKILKTYGVTYCPFCGELSLRQNTSGGELKCQHCGKSLFFHDIDKIEEDMNGLLDSSLAFVITQFKCITYSIDYSDFRIGSKNVVETKINSEGDVEIKRIENGKQSIKSNMLHIKNINDLYNWIYQIEQMIFSANNECILDGEPAKKIDSIIFESFKISSVYMGLGIDNTSIGDLPIPEFIDINN